MRALIVGLDAFTPELTFPWAREGVLPTLGRLMMEGAWGKLESAPNMNSAPAWSSFATGMGPGKHGIFYFTEIVPGTVCRQHLNASHRQGTPFWRRLGALGYRGGVVNVPMSYPADAIDGFLVAGLDAPSPRSPGFSHPPDFFERISRDLAHAYCIEAAPHRFARQGQWEAAAQVILDGLEARREFILRALDEHPLDYLTVVFTAADVVQHFFWQFLEPQAFGTEETESQRLGGVIQQVYRRLDEVLAELIDRTNPEVVVVLSDHGAGFNQRGGDFLFGWLQSVGLLKTRGKEGPVQRLLARLGRRVGGAVGDCPPGAQPIPTLTSVDWSRTKAYCVGTDDVYINLAGREPGGIVPESQYESLCQEIVERLMAVVDPVTKARVVERAVMSRDVYDGPLSHRSPDIVIQWRTEHVLNGLETPGYESVVAQRQPLITGGHRPHGVFFAAGEGIRKGAEIQGAQIVDIAPTLLYTFDDSVPASMDGRVLTEAFESEWIAMHPVMIEERAAEDVEEAITVSEDDAKLVEERLRGLGYID